MRSRRRKKKDSSVKVVFLSLIAIVVMICAVSVILNVYQKISSDYKNLEQLGEEETIQETVAIDTDDTIGWISEEGGYRYRNEDGSFAKDEWKAIDGLLYRFDENGMLRQGEWTEEGQIFTTDDQGYLKDIQQDTSYVPPATGENLDSLVKANAYWCYLGEAEGDFKPILYRKATEQTVRFLGSSSMPEETTRNSLRAYGDYIYYLPKVESNRLSSLTKRQRELCDCLFRVIPGSGYKELIAENVGGYLILGDTIYFSQNYHINSASSGTSIPIGDQQFKVSVENGSCYLLDGTGQPVQGDEMGNFQIGSRIYSLEHDGKILEVSQNEISIGNASYVLEQDSNGKKQIYKRSGDQKEQVISTEFGIQSFCIVNQRIYYCAYVGMEGEWYSQIFSGDLNGGNIQTLGGTFPGTMGQLYFYESAGEIYGEYYPEIWNRGYGRLAAISLNGSIDVIEDQEQRKGETVSDHDRLNLVMADGTDLICLWRDVIWSRSLGVTSTLWNRAVVLDQTKRTPLQTGTPVDSQGGQEEQKAESPGSGTSGDVLVRPIETPVSPAETAAPVEPEVPTVPIQPTGAPEHDPVTVETGGGPAEVGGGPVESGGGPTGEDPVTIVPIG